MDSNLKITRIFGWLIFGWLIFGWISGSIMLPHRQCVSHTEGPCLCSSWTERAPQNRPANNFRINAELTIPDGCNVTELYTALKASLNTYPDAICFDGFLKGWGQPEWQVTCRLKFIHTRVCRRVQNTVRNRILFRLGRSRTFRSARQ